MESDKEFKLDTLARELKEDEVTSFTFKQAQAWSDELGWTAIRPSIVIAGLKERGFTMVERMVEKKIRTMNSNPHDRWQASPSHGGGGGSSIGGMAGREG